MLRLFAQSAHDDGINVTDKPLMETIRSKLPSSSNRDYVRLGVGVGGID
jgi:hypothetical protein